MDNDTAASTTTRSTNGVRTPAADVGLSTFSFFNVRGLKPLTSPSKVGTISDLLLEENQIFIALSETWLTGHKDAEIFIKGYSCTGFRQDRHKRFKRGRGSGGVSPRTQREMLSLRAGRETHRIGRG